jgi:membrane carboxypeptidase/penicillin-binding protein PbpC
VQRTSCAPCWIGGPSRNPWRGTAAYRLETGTSFGFRDAWAVGLSDRYTVGVWSVVPMAHVRFFGEYYLCS